ncbi:hypothetical protein IW140_006291 [Coemansia sp. RSA 1813]|nr:hypothetical protein IW140_006291 [Coemansia sp. RSA 1813]
MKARSARFSPEQTVNDTSSAMTIDNDSNASTRTHIMGVPGARIPSVQLRHIQQQNPVRTRPRAFSTDSPISPTTESPLSFGQQPRRGLAAMHTANARIGTSRAADSQGKARQRRISSSPLGITRDNTLHQQLLLVGAPNPTDATNIVTRLPVEEEENRMPGAYTTAIGSAKVQSPPIEKESSAATAKANKASTSKPKAATRSHSQQHPAASTQTAEPSTARLAQPPHVFTFKAQPSTQEQQHQHNGKIDISNRPIALPKTRLSNLRPTLRQMPKSKEVAQIDAQFSSNGSPVARRPDYFVFEDGPLDEDDHGIELSSSYIDDIGFDLADAELNSDFGKSFDLDMLPDPPPRRLSDYNIGVKEVPIRSPPPEATKGDDDLVKEKSVSENKKKKHSIARQANGAGAPNELQQQQQPLSATSQCTSATSIQSSAYESATDDVSTRFTATPRPTGLAAMVVQEEPETHRTLGLPRNNQLFSKPAITEDNAHFYIKMFALRSTVPAEELSSPESPEQRTGYSSRSITTIENLPAEPVQPQQQERLPSEEQVYNRIQRIGRPPYRTAAINQSPYYYNSYFYSRGAAVLPDYAIAGCYFAAYRRPRVAEACNNNGIRVRLGSAQADRVCHRRWR